MDAPQGAVWITRDRRGHQAGPTVGSTVAHRVPFDGAALDQNILNPDNPLIQQIVTTCKPVVVNNLAVDSPLQRTILDIPGSAPVPSIRIHPILDGIPLIRRRGGHQGCSLLTITSRVVDRGAPVPGTDLCWADGAGPQERAPLSWTCGRGWLKCRACSE